MKKTIKKVFTAALLMTLPLLSAGCNRGKKVPIAPTGPLNNQEYMDDAAVTVDGVKVTYREAMLYMQAAKQEYESAYGGEIWQYQLNEDGSSLGEWVKEQTLEKIISIKIICREAARRGIELDSEEKNYVNLRAEEYMQRAEYSELALYGIARKDVETVYTDNAIAQKLYDSITLNVNTDVTDEEAIQKHIQSLMLKNHHEDEFGNKSPLTVLEMISAMDRFDALFNEAKETSDFYSLAYANTDDKTYLDQYVGEGDLPEAFAEAYDLKTGEAMQIRTDDGYYIFYCVSDFDEEAVAVRKEEIIADRQEKAFQDAYESWKRESKIQVNEEIWHAIGFDAEAKG